MPKKICISAYNIHQGGGKVVLVAFLKEKQAENHQLTCYIDKRLDIDFEQFKKINFIKIKPNLKARLQAELDYKEVSLKFDLFYFLGNLPPIYKLNCRVILFLQNRLIISRPYVNTLSIKTTIRSVMEILWFKVFFKNADIVEVQTPSMKKALQRNSPLKKVDIHNYLDLEELKEIKNSFESSGDKKEKNSFVYITSSDPHKNLHRLILAFAALDNKNFTYTLYVNIDKESKFYRLAKARNVNLKRIESTDRKMILKQIYCSEFLIFPSLIESLGMPLVEAKMMETKIIASNLDFVFDVCEPIAVFDPQSIESIKNAIQRAIL